MNRTPRLLSASSVIIAFASALPVHAQAFAGATSASVSPSALWRDRGNIASLDLAYGSGGKEHHPAGTFTFVKEDKEGTAPKFEIVDDQGVRWKAKIGEEAKPETAAAHLLWAVGYFTDEDYYLPELRVEKLPKLTRGRQFVSEGGIVHGVRLERNAKEQKKIGNWSWSRNPFVGTKELDGLRIMVALLNDWDVKTINNAVYEVKEEESRYVVSDLGATFGRTGGVGDRTKSNLRDYSASKFIAKTDGDRVSVTMKSRPFFLLAIDFYHYQKLAARATIGKNIPRAHAKWLGQLLSQLSPEQIRDCFRSAGYSPADVEGFAKVVEGRIADLNRL